MSLNLMIEKLKTDEDYTKLLDDFSSAPTIHEKFRSYSRIAMIIKMMVDDFRQNPRASELLSPRNIDKDFIVTDIYFNNARFAPCELKINATVYLSVILLCYESLSELTQFNTEKVVSRYAKDDNKQPLDLTNICREITILLIKTAIENTLRCIDPSFEKLKGEHDIVFSLLCNDPFDHASKFGGSPSVLITDMAIYSFTLGPFFPQIAYENIYLDDHNRDGYDGLFTKSARVRQMKLNLLSPFELINTLNEINKIALDLTLWLDDWGLTESKEPEGGSLHVDKNDRTKKQDIFRIAVATGLNSLGPGFCKTKKINGVDVLIEYKPSYSHNREYEKISKAVEMHIDPISRELARIYSTRTIPCQEDCENNGDIAPVDYYRAKADVKIFTQTYQKTDPYSMFYVMALVDNSCSINDNKKRVMGEILTLLVNTIIAHPDKFTHLCAYAQQSDGNRAVTLRRLIDCPVPELANPSSILHLVSSGVNYDAYAAHEIVTTHADQFETARPLLIVCGDSFPVSNSGEDVILETKKIFKSLKEKYPRLITMCLAVDCRYQPYEMYDYFVSLATEQPFSNFINGFTLMIEKILKKEEPS